MKSHALVGLFLALVGARAVDTCDVLSSHECTDYKPPCDSNSTCDHKLPALAQRIADTPHAAQNLHTLSLAHHTLSAADARTLASILQSTPSLATLNLTDTRLGDAGLAALLAKPLPPSLTSLDLAHSYITDEGAKLLFAPAAKWSLTHLDLGWNALSTRAARAIAARLRDGGCPLEELELRWNGLRDRGAAAIAEAFGGETRLRALGLDGNAVHDAGAKDIAKGLRSSKTAREVRLGENGVGGDARAAVGQALSECAARASAESDSGGGEDAGKGAPEKARPRAAVGRDDDDDDVEEISLDD